MNVSPVSLDPYRPVALPVRDTQSVRFGNLGPQVLSNFVADTAGILAPKLLVSSTQRGQKQVAEDVALEALEDVPFYVMVPLLGHHLFAPIFQKLAGSDVTQKAIGTSYRELAKAAKPLSKALLGAKLGTLVATVGLTAGAEYLVYFAKNLVSVGLFNTKNFEAVAGLEASQAHVDDRVDPVIKARTRASQIAKIAAAVVAGSLAIPALVKNHSGVEKLAHKLLKQIDFAHDAKSVFQLSKPIFAVLMASGFVAGLDSARSKLEQWENGIRIAGVITFLLAGREMASNLIAGWLEQSKIRVGDTVHRVGDFVKLTDKSLFQQESALNFSMVKSEEAVAKELAALGQKLTPEARKAILGRVRLLGRNRLPLALSAGVSGLFLTLLSYTQTKWRYDRQIKQAAALDRAAQKPLTSFIFPSPPATQLAINPASPAAAPFAFANSPSPYGASFGGPLPLNAFSSRFVMPPAPLGRSPVPAAMGWSSNF